MLNKVMILIGCVIICLFLSSCYTLHSKHVVGEKKLIENKKIDAEGRWQFEDKDFFTRVIGHGTLVGSSLGWDETKKEYKASNVQIVLTQLDDTNFLNIKESKDDLYTIYRMDYSGDGSIVVYTIKEETMDRHIKEGKVKATKTKYNNSSYILELTKEELDIYIQENINNLFDYGNPIIIKQFKK